MMVSLVLNFMEYTFLVSNFFSFLKLSEILDDFSALEYEINLLLIDDSVLILPAEIKS